MLIVGNDSHAITVPLFKSLAAPLRRVKVTGPLVVGFHVKVEGFPAVTLKSLWTVGGFAVELVCATAIAIRQAMLGRMAKRMVLVVELYQRKSFRKLGCYSDDRESLCFSEESVYLSIYIQ